MESPGRLARLRGRGEEVEEIVIRSLEPPIDTTNYELVVGKERMWERREDDIITGERRKDQMLSPWIGDIGYDLMLRKERKGKKVTLVGGNLYPFGYIYIISLLYLLFSLFSSIRFFALLFY